ncbi:MAG: replicative helicase loader/inhibitor [Clostridiales bacterium]
MTNKDTVLFLGKIKSFYYKFFMNMSKEEMLIMIESWNDMLSEHSINDCLNALKRYTVINKWPPTISDILTELAVFNGEIKTAGESWEKCFKVAINLPNYPGVAYNLENYGLNELELKALKSIGIKEIKMSQNLAIERSNFIRIYESLKDRFENENKMPNYLRLDVIRKIKQQKLKSQNSNMSDLDSMSIKQIIEG